MFLHQDMKLMEKQLFQREIPMAKSFLMRMAPMRGLERFSNVAIKAVVLM